MTRSAKRSWRPRAAAGFSANTPSATATPTPAWCSTRWRGSKKASPPRSSRPPARQRACGSAGRDQARARRGAEPPRPPRSTASRWSKSWRRSARAPGSSGKSPGGGAKSAPTAGFAICSNSQVGAIEAGCGQISSIDPHAALSAAFDLIGGRIAAFDDGDDAPPKPPWQPLRLLRGALAAPHRAKCLPPPWSWHRHARDDAAPPARRPDGKPQRRGCRLGLVGRGRVGSDLPARPQLKRPLPRREASRKRTSKPRRT